MDILDKLQSELESETSEKNRLYHFILSEGLYDKYRDYIKINKKVKRHSDCLNIILKTVLN